MDRFSNCFTFYHSITYDCQGYNDCESGEQCFQDNTTCPSLSICVCSDCYYGTKCQFSISSFILSLDYILGYRIKPNVSFVQQSLIVKMSVVFTPLMFIVGLINALLSMATFCVENARDVGCGVKFNKSASKKIAKWITLLILFLTLITYLHIPLHRHLIDDIDTDEQRSWCLTRCSSSMNIFNSFITLTHFFIPFSIHLLSIVFIIVLVAHSRFTLQPRLTFKQHLELHLIASCALVSSVLPR
ncbi:unnamed protein product [Rotaria magnacalcarata]